MGGGLWGVEHRMGGRGRSGWWYAGIEPVAVDDDAMSCATLGRTTWAGGAADSCSAWLRGGQRRSMVVCWGLDTHDGEGRRCYESRSRTEGPWRPEGRCERMHIVTHWLHPVCGAGRETRVKDPGCEAQTGAGDSPCATCTQWGGLSTRLRSQDGLRATLVGTWPCWRRPCRGSSAARGPQLRRARDALLGPRYCCLVMHAVSLLPHASPPAPPSLHSFSALHLDPERRSGVPLLLACRRRRRHLHSTLTAHETRRYSNVARSP